MKALALDFDGVISDSAREAFAVALHTYRLSNPSARLPREAALYERFLALMPLGNRAEDYAVALSAIEEDRVLEDQAAYRAYYATRDPAFLADFHRRFYRVRDAWRERDPAGWRKLLAPYPGVPELLRRRGDEVLLAVVTAKDRASVEVLLADYGIADLFPGDRIFDKELGVSKRAHLERLREASRLAFEEITFIDDKVNHLEDAASLGVRCALAAWGYNGERERRIARDSGFLVCRLDDVEERLFP